jgi:hypothetical protein
VAEGAPLLREYVGKTCIEGSNPSGSARNPQHMTDLRVRRRLASEPVRDVSGTGRTPDRHAGSAPEFVALRWSRRSPMWHYRGASVPVQVAGEEATVISTVQPSFQLT